MKILNSKVSRSFFFLSLLSATATAYADYSYQWDTAGYCRYVSGGGRVGDVVSDNKCGGYTYQWDTSGNCRYVSKGGRVDDVVSDSKCGGYSYKWDTAGYCRYVSNGGRVDDVVSDNKCGGYTYKWDTAGYCRYVSNGGRVGEVVRDSNCGSSLNIGTDFEHALAGREANSSASDSEASIKDAAGCVSGSSPAERQVSGSALLRRI